MNPRKPWWRRLFDTAPTRLSSEQVKGLVAVAELSAVACGGDMRRAHPSVIQQADDAALRFYVTVASAHAALSSADKRIASESFSDVADELDSWRSGAGPALFDSVSAVAAGETLGSWVIAKLLNHPPTSRPEMAAAAALTAMIRGLGQTIIDQAESLGQTLLASERQRSSSRSGTTKGDSGVRPPEETKVRQDQASSRGRVEYPEHIPCGTLGCGGTPQRLKPSVGLAMIEHGIRSDPAFVLRLHCDSCDQSNSYTYMQLLAMIPPEWRPNVPGSREEWVFVLRFMGTLEDGRNILVGDRVLAKTQLHRNGWVGRALGPSMFEPRIGPGTVLAGKLKGGYRRVLVVGSGEEMRPLTPNGDRFPQGSIFALVYEDADGSLEFDNTFCSNPACNWIFKKTWSEIQEELPAGTDVAPRLTVECPLCRCARVLDEDSFKTPPFTGHPSIPEEWLVLDTPSVALHSGDPSEGTPDHPFLALWAKSYPNGLWSVLASVWIGEDVVRDVELGVVHTPAELIFAAREAARIIDFSFEPQIFRPALPDIAAIDPEFSKELHRQLDHLRATPAAAGPNSSQGLMGSHSPEAAQAVAHLRRKLGPHLEQTSEHAGSQARGDQRESGALSPSRPEVSTVSPFTGQLVDIDRGLVDKSVLFVHRTGTSSYRYMSERVRAHASTLGISPENLAPAELLDILRLLLPEAEGAEVDRGGGSVDFYAFAPPEV